MAFFIDFIFVLLIGSVMLASTDDCDTPIRQWLFGIVCLHVAHFLMTCIIEMTFYIDNWEHKSLMNMYKMLHIPILLFLLAWFILGNIWWFGDTSCSDFEKGYYLALSLLILYYILFIAIFAFVTALLILYCTKRTELLNQLKSKLLGQPYDVIE